MAILQVGELFRTLPRRRAERWDLLDLFFAEWYGGLGPTDGCSPQSIRAAEMRLHVFLPTALREWYALAGRRKAVWCCQDDFLEPEELRVEGDKLIICIEAQAVVEWCISQKSLPNDDPPVYVTDQSDSTKWIEETPSVSVFALTKLLLDAKFAEAIGPFFSANGQATGESLAAIARTYQKLDFPDLSWPANPTRFYGGTDLLIETDGETWIWVSGRSKATFCPAIELIAGMGVEWERVEGL